MPAAKKEEIEKIEISLLLDALYQRYGYDFRHYAHASVKRRVHRLLEKSGCATISDMIPKVLYDDAFAQDAIFDFSIVVTEMFRDPDFYSVVRKSVVPYLKTYPFIKVWHVGCATGEEIYSLAILLHEENLYDRTTIFATDFNDAVLEKAKEGIYALKDMRQYTLNYQKAGGTRSFADYYHAQYESAIMNPSLKRNMTFASHNLVTDRVFGEMHLVFCRNVLIYFDKVLQNQVLELLAQSLSYGGFLCLGSKEKAEFSSAARHFRVVDGKHSIYQKHIA